MEIALGEGRYGLTPPSGGSAAAAAAAAAADRPSTSGRPTSSPTGTTSTDAAEYSENARLVSSALSDDGMTPLISPGRSRRQQAVRVLKAVLAFCLSHWSKAAILGVIITLIVLVSIKGFGIFGEVLAWFQRHNGWAGWGIFVGMYTAVVALFLPGVVLILGAGFVFGFWRGLLAVWAGGAVGQALAFLLARYLFRGWVESTLRTKWRRWTIIDQAIQHDGWKLVLIMRFSPIIPYNLLNIAMATTSIPFWQFTVVSAVGIVYECAVFAYFGSMADSIHSVVSGEGGLPSAVQWVMLGVSLLMCVVGAIFVSYTIKQAIRRAQQHASQAGLSDGGGLEADEDAELGVRLHPSYPASLEREGFVSGGGGGLGGQGAGGYASLAQQQQQAPGSPEFELKAVGGGGGGGLRPSSSLPATVAPAASAAGSDKRLLGGAGSLEAGTLLALTAASGSGGLLGPSRGPSQKLKTSPKASMDRLDGSDAPLQRRFSSLEDGGDGEGGAAALAALRPRHPSSGGENLHL